MKILIASCAAQLVCPAAVVQEIPLRPMTNPAPDVFVNKGPGALPTQFTVVNRPSIFVFLPPKETATGVAVVVAPGGGHSQLVIDKEGWEMADWFNKQGIAAFVLKYRLARAVNSSYTVDHIDFLPHAGDFSAGIAGTTASSGNAGILALGINDERGPRIHEQIGNDRGHSLAVPCWRDREQMTRAGIEQRHGLLFRLRRVLLGSKFKGTPYPRINPPASSSPSSFCCFTRPSAHRASANLPSSRLAPSRRLLVVFPPLVLFFPAPACTRS